MDLSETIKAIIERERAEVPTPVKSWYTEGTINRFILDCLADDVRQGTDQLLTFQFSLRVPVREAPLYAYRMQAIAVEEGEQVLASINFIDLYPDRAFVEVEHRTFAIRSADQIRGYAREIAGHFPWFRPQYVRFSDWTGALYEAGRDRSIRDIVCEHRLMAAPLQRLRMLPSPPHLERIHLKLEDDLAFYPDYAAAYDAFHAEHPDLKEPVFKEPFGSMRYYVNDGQVYSIYIDDAWAGVITAIDHREWFYNGYMVADFILKPDYRGKGFAAAVHRALIDTLEYEGSYEPVLMGTINPANTPSIKAALRTGRIDVGGKYQVYVDGHTP